MTPVAKNTTVDLPINNRIKSSSLTLNRRANILITRRGSFVAVQHTASRPTLSAHTAARPQPTEPARWLRRVYGYCCRLCKSLIKRWGWRRTRGFKPKIGIKPYSCTLRLRKRTESGGRGSALRVHVTLSAFFLILHKKIFDTFDCFNSVTCEWSSSNSQNYTNWQKYQEYWKQKLISV